MSKAFLCFSMIAFFMSNPGFGQEGQLDQLDFENIIQKLLPQQEFDVDYNDFYDRLFTLYTAPIDINRAQRSDFQSLYFLNELQIDGILHYRDTYGSFRTLFELMTIEGFDRTTIEQLKHFVRISNEDEQKWYNTLLKPVNHQVFLRYQTVMEAQKGYSTPDTLSDGSLTSRYAGGPSRLYGRYLYARPGSYSFGFTTEKDPGEKLTWDPSTHRYGMDYYAFHAMIENLGMVQKVIVGDFTMDFGQGLVFGSGIRVGKGIAPVSTIRRNNMGLRPYRSVYESRDYRGLALSARHKKLDFHVFVSNVPRDARWIDQEDINSQPLASGISEVGLHRTPTEIASKHSLKDRAIGANINLRLLNSKLEIGVNGIQNRYSAELLPTRDKYRLYQFQGISNYNVSSYINYFWKRGHLFGELASSRSGGMALSSGVIVSLSSQVQTALHYRNYGREYHAYANNAFGENTSSSNEEGLYWGISIKPLRNVLVTGYFDYFSFPWLKYRVDAPSVGRDFMASVIYDFDSKTSIRFQFRDKIKDENHTEDDERIVSIVAKNTQRLIFDISHQASSQFSFRTWIQHIRVNLPDNESIGFMLAQDISYKAKKVSLAGRFALFDSDDYDSRMFIYERDLLYVYSVPSFSNQGARYYLLASYNYSPAVSFWLKFAQTRFYNLSTIGSGLDQIDGDTKSNLSFQVRLKFQ
jgi:hypothetical protein